MIFISFLFCLNTSLLLFKTQHKKIQKVKAPTTATTATRSKIKMPSSITNPTSTYLPVSITTTHDDPNDKIIQETSTSSSTSSSSTTSTITILGFGSLLSETSAQTTFPNLTNFRLGQVHDYKRVFAHPASIFFQRNIANYDTLEMSSLSAEYCPGSSFICSVFEVSNENGEFMEVTDAMSTPTLSASMAFREREEEFDIKIVPYEEMNNNHNKDHKKESNTSNINNNSDDAKTMGVLCCRSTDEKYIKQWGQSRFEENYLKYNIKTIWNWKKDSGLKPCGPYLRHCVLASKKMGELCHDSFLDETFLVDRKTTIRSYLEEYPEIMDTLPPVELQSRYGG